MEREFLIDGTGFLVIDDAYPLVHFEGSSATFTAHAADGCSAVPGQPDTVLRCTRLTVRIPMQGLPPGLHQVRVQNPLSADCTSVEDRQLLIVPPPVVQSIEPDLLCITQNARPFTIKGRDFLDIDGELPLVTIGPVTLQAETMEGCTPVTGAPVAVNRCDTLHVLIPQASVPDGLWPVTVTNPEDTDCTSSEKIDLLFVPPPTLARVLPDLICVAETDRSVTLEGTGFISHGDALPTVMVGSLVLTATSLAGCIDLPGPLLATTSCTEMLLEIPADSLPEGSHDVVVTNPPPADCSGTEAVTLAVTLPPALLEVDPVVFCDDQDDTRITLTGQHFLRVDEALPVIAVGDIDYPATSVHDCTPIQGTLLEAEACTGLSFTIPAGGLPEGWHDLTVTNPLPSSCTTVAPDAIFALSAPVILRVQTVAPCDMNPIALRIEGTGFVVQDGTFPSIVVQGTGAIVTDASGCSPVEGTGIEICTGLQMSIPSGTLSPGPYTVELVNPGANACSADAMGTILVPPEIVGVDPANLCEGGGTIVVTGNGFVPGAKVRLGSNDLPTTFVDGSTLEAEVADIQPGTYDVTIVNPDGCEDTLASGFVIEPMPILYFVDPPVLYNGINLQVKIYASGIIGNVIEVTIHPEGSPQEALALDFTFDPAEPGRLQAVVPAGLAPGDYQLTVMDDRGCFAELAGALTIVEELTMAIERVEMPFGWTDSATGVNIYSPAIPPEGHVNFAATPRFYLNPTVTGPDTLATELKFTAFASPLRCSATIRAGLPVGYYDLVAVNPDGSVGFLAQAFLVTADPPPLVTDIAPTSLANQGIHEIEILGEHFDETPTVAITCRQPNGVDVPLTPTFVSADPTRIVVSVNFGVTPVSAGSACVFRVTNENGTYDDHSAMGITNPSLNLTSFDAATDMEVPRRAPCALAGEATPGARFVYAIGGDNGTSKDTDAAIRHSTVEFAAIDAYGTLESWQVQPYELPVGLGFHGCAQLGRFLYVTGGNTAGGTVNTTYRAKVLDPAEAPVITDVNMSVVPGEPPAMPAGLWSYRISAVMADVDPENPGGETLAGDALLMQTPDISDRLDIRITWTEVPGATAYRIYRTPTRNLPSGFEVLLAEVPAEPRVFTDDGTLVPGDAIPLPFGSTGRFANLPALGKAREGHGVVLSVDPADSTTYYLYAMGGRDQTGAALSSIEWLTITVAPDGSQTVDTDWTQGNANIGTPRWQMSSYLGNNLMAPRTIPAGTIWTYAMGGVTADLQFLVNDVVALRVAPGGALGEGVEHRWAVTGMQPPAAGYAGSLFNDQIFVFGGNQGTPNANGYSVQICSNNIGACAGGPPGAPDLANWNNLGLAMTHPRYLSGGVVVSAFMFLIGGVGELGAMEPLAATEKTLW
jgi:hypothetical protein